VECRATHTFETWDSRSGPFAVGPFTITPILTDHSAFDAYMLLVEGAGNLAIYGPRLQRAKERKRKQS
jgi:ribonuclease J